MARMILVISMVVNFGLAASATDGVLEINQACAVHTGCFSGDDPGWPVEITNTGSYRLTSNLVVPSQETTAILLSSSYVGIDLNNFSLIRSTCDLPDSCDRLAGAGNGILDEESSGIGNSVMNGSVVGFGDKGIDIGAQSTVTNVRASFNGDDGIKVDGGSIVSGCNSLANGDDGIQAWDSLINGNRVGINQSDGIVAFGESAVQDNHATYNFEVGIRFLSGTSAYRGNVVINNNVGQIVGGTSSGGNFCAGPATASPDCP